MKIGIMSDSHDQIDNIKKAVDFFNDQKVDMVYHLGDLCSPFTLKLFGKLDCPMKGVFGNNDADIYRHMRWAPKNVEFFGKFHVEEIEGKKICLFHGDPNEIMEPIYKGGDYDIVLRGHNHIAEIKKVGKTLVINPGPLIRDFPENRKKYSWTEPSIAIYDFEKDEAKIYRLYS